MTSHVFAAGRRMAGRLSRRKTQSKASPHVEPLETRALMTAAGIHAAHVVRALARPVVAPITANAIHAQANISVATRLNVNLPNRRVGAAFTFNVYARVRNFPFKTLAYSLEVTRPDGTVSTINQNANPFEYVPTTPGRYVFRGDATLRVDTDFGEDAVNEHDGNADDDDPVVHVFTGSTTVNVVAKAPPAPPPAQQKLTQQQKDQLNLDAIKLFKIEAIGGVVSTGVGFFTFGFGLLGGALSAVVSLDALDLQERAIKDPPDPNYKTVPTPTPPSLPPLVLQPGLTLAEVNAYNALLVNFEQQIAYGNAMTDAGNRASTAEAAGDLASRDLQVLAGRDFAAHWAQLLTQSTTLEAQLAQTLRAGHFPTPGISRNQFAAWEQQVAVNGLPVFETLPMQEAGADAGMIALFQHTESTQRPQSFVGGLPALLTNTDLVSAERQAARVLATYAATGT